AAATARAGSLRAIQSCRLQQQFQAFQIDWATVIASAVLFQKRFRIGFQKGIAISIANLRLRRQINANAFDGIIFQENFWATLSFDGFWRCRQNVDDAPVPRQSKTGFKDDAADAPLKKFFL